MKKKTEENYKKARIQFSHKLESKQTPTKGNRKKKSLLRAKITQIGSKQAQTERLNRSLQSQGGTLATTTRNRTKTNHRHRWPKQVHPFSSKFKQQRLGDQQQKVHNKTDPTYSNSTSWTLFDLIHHLQRLFAIYPSNSALKKLTKWISRITWYHRSINNSISLQSIVKRPGVLFFKKWWLKGVGPAQKACILMLLFLLGS